MIVCDGCGKGIRSDKTFFFTHVGVGAHQEGIGSEKWSLCCRYRHIRLQRSKAMCNACRELLVKHLKREVDRWIREASE